MSKLTKVQKNFLAQLNITAKRWAHKQFQDRKIDTEEINSFSKKEGELYRQWLNDALQEIHKIKLDYLFKSWVQELEQDISVKQLKTLLATIKREYIKTEDSKKRKSIGKILSLLTGFYNLIMDTHNKMYESLNEGVPFDEVIELGKKINISSAIKSEERIFMKQAVNHLEQMLKNGGELNINAIKIAFAPTFNRDFSLVERRIDLLIKINRMGKLTDEIKHIGYDFIEAATKESTFFNAKAIYYLFEGKWISETTYSLLKRLYPLIDKVSMNILVVAAIKKLLPEIEDDAISTAYALELKKLYE